MPRTIHYLTKNTPPPMNNLLSIKQLSKENIKEILNLTKKIEENTKQYENSLKGKSLITAFFEESTRTRIGFSLAMQKLGGNVESLIKEKSTEAMAWEESTKDTLKVLSDYCDLLCLRHPSTNLAKEITKKIDTKIINCGNGSEEHPTQTLIDLYTIWKEKETLENLHIALIGDTKNMRTAHSLLLALEKFEGNITLITPKHTKTPKQYLPNKKKISIEHTLKNLPSFDVIYMLGIPIHKNKEITIKELISLSLTKKAVEKMKEKAIILSPLPRLDEIPEEIDKDKRAKYFEQSKNGIYVRMAILQKMLQP